MKEKTNEKEIFSDLYIYNDSHKKDTIKIILSVLALIVAVTILSVT
jgi:hypothetical protein